MQERFLQEFVSTLNILVITFIIKIEHSAFLRQWVEEEPTWMHRLLFWAWESDIFVSNWIANEISKM